MSEHMIKGIYIHVPFCVSKCAYCAFYSEANVSDSVKLQYTTRLIKDIKKTALNIDKDENIRLDLKSLYFGGGTPSLLNIPMIGEILETVKKSFKIDLEDLSEITVEVNPGTIDRDYLRGLKSLGINRVSIGVQTLSDKHLKDIGRIHSRKEAIEALDLLIEEGFENVSVDIMFGLPGQTLEDLKETLDVILSYPNVKHISAYSLIIEENTPLERRLEKGGITLVDEDLEREMQYFINDYLRDKGFRHYEISNYAIPGYEAVHNTFYWTLDDYLGFGPGASAFIGNKRIDDHTRLSDYIQDIKDFEESYSNKEVLKEDYMILGLRLLEGIDPEDYSARFSSDLMDDYGEQVNRLIERGLLERTDSKIRLTPLGLDLANQVFVEFVKI